MRTDQESWDCSAQRREGSGAPGCEEDGAGPFAPGNLEGGAV